MGILSSLQVWMASFPREPGTLTPLTSPQHLSASCSHDPNEPQGRLWKNCGNQLQGRQGTTRREGSRSHILSCPGQTAASHPAMNPNPLSFQDIRARKQPPSLPPQRAAAGRKGALSTSTGGHRIPECQTWKQTGQLVLLLPFMAKGTI